MKKKINKQIPCYAYGASEVIGAVTNGLSTTIPYATSGKATVGTALSSALSGASAGAALGPYGALGGAIIGGVMGSIGTDGSVDPYTGEITDPSGIAGMVGRSKASLRRESKRIKNTNIARLLTNTVRADYYNNFANGGTVSETAHFFSSPGELYVRPQSHEAIMVDPDAEPNGKDNIFNAEPEGGGGKIFSHKNKILAKEDPFGLKPKKNITDAEYMKKVIKPNKKPTDKYAQGTLDAQYLNAKIAARIVEDYKQKNGNGSKNWNKYSTGTPYVQLGKDMFADLYNPVINTEIEDELTVRKNKAKKAAKKEKWDKFASLAPSLAQLAAPITNIVKSKSKVEKPTAYTITPTYGRTTIDNRPLLRQIAETNAITRYNTSNLGSAGQAYAVRSALDTNKSLADIWSDTYNKETALTHQNAQIANGIKEFNSQVMHTADVEYAQNKAAKANMWTTGVSQLGQISGGIGKDIAANKVDAGVYQFLRPYLEYGINPEYLSLLDKKYGVAV